MVGDGVDTRDALRQMRKSILTFRGIVVKVPDLDSLSTVKDGLDKILTLEGYGPSRNGDSVVSPNGANIIYASGRYTPEFVERIRRYIKGHSAEMCVFKGKERDFEGPYWIYNASMD